MDRQPKRSRAMRLVVLVSAGLLLAPPAPASAATPTFAAGAGAGAHAIGPMTGNPVARLAGVAATPARTSAAGTTAPTGLTAPTSTTAPTSLTATTTLTRTSTRKPRARVSATYWPTATGRAIVEVTSDARKVRVKYRNAKGRAKSKTVKLAQGTRRIVLPKGAKRIRAVARPTTKLRVSTTVKAQRGDTRFSLVVIPDTQMETGHRPGLFTDRMQWIAENQAAHDIRFVIQVGDLVDTDNCGDESLGYLSGDTRPQCNEAMRAAGVFYPLPGRPDHHQYRIASAGIATLDRAGVPYAIAVGNHDTAAVCGGTACVGGDPDWGVPPGTRTNDLLRNTATWNTYFPPARFRGVATNGTFEPGRSDNMYQTFTAGGHDWMVLTLELWPRPEVVAWASSVVAAHPRHNVLVNTHQFLSSMGGLSPSAGGYGNTSPQYLYDQLISRHSNIAMTFSGHNPGARVTGLPGADGRRVLSFLDTFHDTSNAQTRLIEVDTAAGTLSTHVRYNASDPTRVVPGASVDLSGLALTLPR